jgi:hypothetical protein
MSKEKVGNPGKKDLRKEIFHQLEISLSKLKEPLGEKKFHSRLKKAVRLLTENIDMPKKEQPQKEKPAIKITPDDLIVKPPQKSAKVIAPAIVPAPKAAAKKTIKKATSVSKIKK